MAHLAPTPSVHDAPIVLFVDDEPSILSALRRVFRGAGYRLHFATSAAEGLQILDKEAIDVVVSDMRMPEMDGAAFLEAVRKQWPDTQRLLLTGYADMGSTIAAINRGGIERYIAKPWEDDELLALVRDAASRRLLERENLRLMELTRQQSEQLSRMNAELEARVVARTAEIEQVSAMLELAYKDLDDSFLLLMDVLPGLLELRSSGSAGHSRQVGRLAKDIAQRLQLPERQTRDVYIAGLLHAIGTISLPDTLLRKPLQSMSKDEQARYHRHPLAAEAALMPVNNLRSVVQLVRMQYERFDGQGFPDGLAGDELPVEAQIVAIARNYVELTEGRLSDRKYSSEAALTLLRGQINAHHGEDVYRALHAVAAAQQPDAPADAISLGVQDLRPGMVLASDLMSARGTLLLAAGYRFDDASIRTIQDLLNRDQTKLAFHVRKQAAPDRRVAV